MRTQGRLLESAEIKKTDVKRFELIENSKVLGEMAERLKALPC